MKTNGGAMLFDQLKFEDHHIAKGHKAAKIEFPNGYGASVITGMLFYTDPEHPYELGVIHNGRLTYSTPITDDVVGYLTREGVEELLVKIRELPQEPAK